MEKRIIYIASEHRTVFANIVALYKEKYIANDKIAYADDNEIEPAGASYKFVISTRTEDKKEHEIKMTNKGSTWFQFVREKKEGDSDSALWDTFVSDIAVNFHENYSVLEYEQKDLIVTASEIEKRTEAIQNMMRKFYPNLSYTVRHEAKKTDANLEEIYSVSLMLYMNNKTGESKKVLADLYFKYERGIYIPLSAERANAIQSQMLATIPEWTDNESSSVDINKLDSVLNAVDKTIKDKMMQECLVYRSETDYEIINKYISNGVQNGSNNDVPICCSKISPIGLTHVKWYNDFYFIEVNGKPVMTAKFTSDDSMSLKCALCANENELITSNTIVYHMEDEFDLTVTPQDRIMTINPYDDDLGLDDEQFEEIMRFSTIKDHMFPVSCNGLLSLKKSCERTICKEKSITFDGIRKCADCPYEEVVYHNLQGQAIGLSDKMRIAYDKYPTLQKPEDVVKCRVCGRSMLKTDGKRVCSLCQSADGSLNKQLYKKYADYFSPFFRLFHLADKKHISEDYRFVRIKFGKTIYEIDKEKMTTKGYNPSPKSIHKEG